MKYRFIVPLGLILLIAGLPRPAIADNNDNFFSISLFPPLQIVPKEESVSAFRLNLLAGWNKDVEAFDIGLINGATDTLQQFGLGLANISEQDTYDLRIGLVNYTGRDQKGFQVGLYNHAGNLIGSQWGIVNYSSWLGESSMYRAWQIGILNITREMDDGGIQVGLLFNPIQ